MATKTGITHQLLKELAKCREGSTARKLWQACDLSDDVHTFHVLLSNQLTKGRVRVDGVTTCSECCHEARCYRITEAGRIYLTSKGEQHGQ